MGQNHKKKNAVCTSFSLGKPMDFHSYVYLPVVIRCFSSQCSLRDSIFRFIVLTCSDSKQQNSQSHSQLHGDFFLGAPGIPGHIINTLWPVPCTNPPNSAWNVARLCFLTFEVICFPAEARKWRPPGNKKREFLQPIACSVSLVNW